MMDGLSRFDAPPPQSILGDRDGITFNPDLDRARLNEQAQAVWNAMADGAWHTPENLEATTGYNWASISARCRDFRKPAFGGHTVERERAGHGLFRYRLVPNPGKHKRYQDFLAAKAQRVGAAGVEPSPLPDHLFDFQQEVTGFAIRQGRAGMYLDTGLGKTRCELEWSAQVLRHLTGKARSLILTPLAVARQVEREGQALGYDCRVIRDQSEAKSGINICNYDRLDKIDADAFGAVALDESSILKSFGGKISAGLIGAFANHRFRLSATATPAPNDHMELGQQSSFLGIMPANEMLMRWFINDTKEASQQWRLKGHAARDFWDWMASWSRMAQGPEDLGFDGSRFKLPELNVIRHRTQGHIRPMDGGLFAGAVSATNMHEVKRQTSGSRADIIAALADTGEPFLVWCDTDYEADALKARIKDAVEVRGSMAIDKKEEALEAFSIGQARVIITKPGIAGHGLNWQHCSAMGFCGRTFSYELWYQAVRRCWRFGQTKPVTVHIAVAEGEDQIGAVIDRKSAGHAAMKAEMAEAMRRAVGRHPARKIAYDPSFKGNTPSWLTSIA